MNSCASETQFKVVHGFFLPFLAFLEKSKAVSLPLLLLLEAYLLFLLCSLLFVYHLNCRWGRGWVERKGSDLSYIDHKNHKNYPNPFLSLSLKFRQHKLMKCLLDTGILYIMANFICAEYSLAFANDLMS